jgi:hypothetical protein
MIVLGGRVRMLLLKIRIVTTLTGEIDMKTWKKLLVLACATITSATYSQVTEPVALEMPPAALVVLLTGEGPAQELFVTISGAICGDPGSHPATTKECWFPSEFAVFSMAGIADEGEYDIAVYDEWGGKVGQVCSAYFNGGYIVIEVEVDLNWAPANCVAC